MTMTESRPGLDEPTTTIAAALPALRPVAVDLYRDIHKGIRTAMFDLVGAVGRLDPADAPGRARVAGSLDDLVEVLVNHAHHEDGPIQPVLFAELPDLARRIEAEHEAIEARMSGLRELAAEAVAAEGADARFAVHSLYVDLAAFAGDYLAHQDVEERVVMPALEAAIGVEAVGAIHGAIIGSIPPDEMAEALVMMLPAMCIDDRAEMLGGMRDGAPPEVFAGVWSLAGTVLTGPDHTALASRLGIS